MFKLVKLNDETYSLVGPKVNFEGNLHQTIRKMKSLMKFLNEDEKDEEIEMGMIAVENNDFAEYGIFGRFIFAADFDRKVG